MVGVEVYPLLECPGDSIAQWKLTRPPCRLFNQIVLTVELPHYVRKPPLACAVDDPLSSLRLSRAPACPHTAQGLGEPARSRYMAWTIASSLQRRVDWASRPSASSCRILQSDIFNPLSGMPLLRRSKVLPSAFKHDQKKAPRRARGSEVAL